MFRSTLFALAVAAAVAGCGGGGAAPLTGGGPGETGGALASFTISHPEGAVPVGDTLIMQVSARDGAGQAITGVQPQFTSTDASVATVDGAGVVRGLKQGAATIQASLTAGGVTKTATFAVAVLPGPGAPPPAQTIAAFALNPAALTLQAGGTAPLDAVATDAAGARVGNLPQITWTVQDATKATVAAGVVTAVAAGSTSVTASFVANGTTWTASASVTVTQVPPTAPNAAAVQGVEDAFAPSGVTIAAGGTVTWTMVDEEHDVTWQGAAPTGGSIGRIDRGQSAARTFPTAGTYTYLCDRHDGDHGGTVTVVQGGGSQTPVLTSVRITPAGPSVAVGGTVQLTATPLDQAGQPMAGVPAAQWTSANAAVATVSAAGVATGVAAGTAGVTARITHNGATREATVTLTVGSTPPPPPPPPPPAPTVTTPGTTFSPASVTIAAGGTVTWQFTGSTRHNVTFSGTQPPGGNIPDTDAGGTAQRQFPTAGTYSYTCTRHSGMNGTVVVQP